MVKVVKVEFDELYGVDMSADGSAAWPWPATVGRHVVFRWSTGCAGTKNRFLGIVRGVGSTMIEIEILYGSYKGSVDAYRLGKDTKDVAVLRTSDLVAEKVSSDEGIEKLLSGWTFAQPDSSEMSESSSEFDSSSSLVEFGWSSKSSWYGRTPIHPKEAVSKKSPTKIKAPKAIRDLDLSWQNGLLVSSGIPEEDLGATRSIDPSVVRTDGMPSFVEKYVFFRWSKGCSSACKFVGYVSNERVSEVIATDEKKVLHVLEITSYNFATPVGEEETDDYLLGKDIRELYVFKTEPKQAVIKQLTCPYLKKPNSEFPIKLFEGKWSKSGGWESYVAPVPMPKSATVSSSAATLVKEPVKDQSSVPLSNKENDNRANGNVKPDPSSGTSASLSQPATVFQGDMVTPHRSSSADGSSKKKEDNVSSEPSTRPTTPAAQGARKRGRPPKNAHLLKHEADIDRSVTTHGSATTHGQPELTIPSVSVAVDPHGDVSMTIDSSISEPVNADESFSRVSLGKKKSGALGSKSFAKKRKLSTEPWDSMRVKQVRSSRASSRGISALTDSNDEPLDDQLVESGHGFVSGPACAMLVESEIKSGPAFIFARSLFPQASMCSYTTTANLVC